VLRLCVQIVRMVEAVNRAFIIHGLQPFYEVRCSAPGRVVGHMRC
jgi:hypothetical protein